MRTSEGMIRSMLESTATQIIQPLNNICFDWRKDKVMVYERKGYSTYRTTAVEEDILPLSEPGSVYITNIINSITNFVTQKGNLKMIRV